MPVFFAVRFTILANRKSSSPFGMILPFKVLNALSLRALSETDSIFYLASAATPVLENAKALSEELNVPIPAPSQFSEPLMKPGEWIFSPAILQPSPTPSPALSPTPNPTQSHPIEVT